MNRSHYSLMKQAREDALKAIENKPEADMSHVTNDSDLWSCMVVKKTHISHLRVGIDKNIIR